jgi:Essential protein Yae1, N terminal
MAGLQEGRDLGKAKGYEIGYEVGLYEGGVPLHLPRVCPQQ